MKKINQGKMFKHVNFLFKTLCVLIVVTRTKLEDPCKSPSKEYCGLVPVTYNSPLNPLIQGKCCFGLKEGEEDQGETCHYEDNLSYDKILTSGLTCNTLLETCALSKPSTLDDKGACIYKMVEAPYSCCFIKYRYQAFCLPINLKDKKIFKETQYKLRTYYGWEDGGKIDIICGRGTFNKVGKMFLMLAVLFLF